MSDERVILVLLRRPKSRNIDPNEMRSDPFWEFGSFGITQCHCKNLMNVRNAQNLAGVRLAFVQGGNRGSRLVHLTGSVKIVVHKDRLEAVWSLKEMPFKYDCAPILISNTEKSHFPEFELSIRGGRRTSAEGQLSSNFRSRASCIGESSARELIRIYTEIRGRAPNSAFASCYADALPWLPPIVDKRREETYLRLLSEAEDTQPDHGCRSRKRQCASSR